MIGQRFSWMVAVLCGFFAAVGPLGSAAAAAAMAGLEGGRAIQASAPAEAGMAPAVLRAGAPDAQVSGRVELAAAPILMIPYIEEILEMDFRRLLAWIGGLTIGNVALSGLELPYVGLIAGALIGEYWYSQRIFPFDGTF